MHWHNANDREALGGGSLVVQVAAVLAYVLLACVHGLNLRLGVPCFFFVLLPSHPSPLCILHHMFECDAIVLSKP